MRRLRGHRPIQPAILVAALVYIAATTTLRAESPTPLAPLRFLLGQWEGIGDQAGATGGFTFTTSVQDHVIVRTNYSITPAGHGQPASRHDDLMIIYAESGLVKADYFDNEGHVIRYVVSLRDGEAVFLSEIKASEPRYRLTYTRGAGATLTGTFDIAAPGKPESFSPYLSWTARKRK